MKLNYEALLKVLPDAMMGWVNVFIVIAAIVIVVSIMNKISSGR